MVVSGAQSAPWACGLLFSTTATESPTESVPIIAYITCTTILYRPHPQPYFSTEDLHAACSNMRPLQGSSHTSSPPPRGMATSKLPSPVDCTTQNWRRLVVHQRRLPTFAPNYPTPRPLAARPMYRNMPLAGLVAATKLNHDRDQIPQRNPSAMLLPRRLIARGPFIAHCFPPTLSPPPTKRCRKPCATSDRQPQRLLRRRLWAPRWLRSRCRCRCQAPPPLRRAWRAAGSWLP